MACEKEAPTPCRTVNAMRKDPVVPQRDIHKLQHAAAPHPAALGRRAGHGIAVKQPSLNEERHRIAHEDGTCGGPVSNNPQAPRENARNNTCEGLTSLVRHEGPDGAGGVLAKFAIVQHGLYA
jgi:hypothetical protein